MGLKSEPYRNLIMREKQITEHFRGRCKKLEEENYTLRKLLAERNIKIGGVSLLNKNKKGG